jgi:hypothetical protein
MTQSDPANFFDDLERQLVAATTDRPRRLRRARNRSIATMCTILVAVLAVGGGLAAALSNTSNNSGGAPAARQQHTPAPAATVPVPAGAPCGAGTRAANGVRTVDPSSIQVAVLNGTTVPGLARGVAMRLENDRYKIGTVTNAATQDHSTTQVYYGRPACRTAAILIAQAIDLIRLTDHVGPMSNGVAVIAGGQADVAVVVGSDQDTRP